MFLKRHIECICLAESGRYSDKQYRTATFRKGLIYAKLQMGYPLADMDDAESGVGGEP